MDFARKIDKPDVLAIHKRRPLLYITTRDKPLSADVDIVSEDNRLLNWKRWLAERKRLNRHIESTGSRSQVDQLHSFTDRFRSLVEMKELMGYASIPTPVVPDKYRGGPEFWRKPEYLPDRGDICLPQISLAPTRKDLNLPPDLTRIGLPDLTAKEQNLTAVKAKEDLWERSEYLRTRRLELAREIALLLPKEPEMATLAIRGRSFGKRKPERRVPPIIIRSKLDDIPESYPASADRERAILRIQDREFVRQRGDTVSEETQPADDSIVWSLIFESKIDQRVEKEIVLENKGSRVIAYHWRDSSFHSSNVTLERRASPFFFNKTKGLVLLGQTVRIKVWYLSRKRGVFTESWRLVTEPRLDSSAFVVRLWGCTSDTKYPELADRRAIDEYLGRCTRDSTIHAIIEEIASSAMENGIPEPKIRMLLSPSDYFCCQNVSYYCHPTIVMRLQNAYCEISLECGEAWNLSLDSMRDCILIIEDLNYKRELFALFNELCKENLRPELSLVEEIRCSKYDTVYNLLCVFANLFDDISEFARKTCPTPGDLATDRRKSLQHSSQRSKNDSSEVHDEKAMQDRPRETTPTEETSDSNLQLYAETLFIRIYKALEDAVERICISIDSCNKLERLA